MHLVNRVDELELEVDLLETWDLMRLSAPASSPEAMARPSQMASLRPFKPEQSDDETVTMMQIGTWIRKTKNIKGLRYFISHFQKILGKGSVIKVFILHLEVSLFKLFQVSCCHNQVTL